MRKLGFVIWKLFWKDYCQNQLMYVPHDVHKLKEIGQISHLHWPKIYIIPCFNATWQTNWMQIYEARVASHSTIIPSFDRCVSESTNKSNDAPVVSDASGCVLNSITLFAFNTLSSVVRINITWHWCKEHYRPCSCSGFGYLFATISDLDIQIQLLVC